MYVELLSIEFLDEHIYHNVLFLPSRHRYWFRGKFRFCILGNYYLTYLLF